MIPQQQNERALRECILCKIGLTVWVIYLVDWLWQRSRTQSIGPNDSNERCAMSRVLFRINIAAITENTWPWPFTFDRDLFPWPLTLIFDLEINLLIPWCFEENITKCIVLSVNILQPTSFVSKHFATNQKSLRLPVPKLWLKRWCSWFLMCLTLTFQGHLIFVNSPFVPLHDWCKFWSDIFINSGDIAHWNMEKLPILYNGNFRCHGNVCYVFPIYQFFCKLHRIGPSNMCVNF